MPDSDSVTADQASDAAKADSAVSTADASQRDSQPAVTSPATDSPAKPGDAPNGTDPSLTANTDTQSNSAKPQTVPQPTQRDVDNLKRTLAQRQTENQRLQRQLEPYREFDPQTLAAFRKQQSEAQASKLPMWSAKHPENSKFSELKIRWQHAQGIAAKLMQGKTVEEQEGIRANLLQDFSPQDQQVMREHAQHRQRFTERLAEDPEGTLAEMMQSQVQSMLQQRDQRAQQQHSAEQNVGTWFQDQANSPVVDTQREWMVQSLEQGVPWTIVRLEAENRHLRAQVGTSTARVLSAEERSRLAKGNAAITRDPVTAPISDPFELAMKMAKEKGIAVGGNGWNDLVHSLGVT